MAESQYKVISRGVDGIEAALNTEANGWKPILITSSPSASGIIVVVLLERA